MITVTPLASSSRGNAYLIESSGAPALLLEAGLQFNELRRRIWSHGIEIRDLAGCLISHEHGDHARAALKLAASGVDIYTSEGTAAAFAGKLNHRIRPVIARQQFMAGPWAVLPFETIHDAAEPLGFLIGHGAGKLVYATDTPYISVRFKGLTGIMIECNYDAEILDANRAMPAAVKPRVIKNHFGLEQVKEFLKANDLRAVREIWLLHLSDGNADAAKFKAEIQALTGKPVYVADE